MGSCHHRSSRWLKVKTNRRLLRRVGDFCFVVRSFLSFRFLLLGPGYHSLRSQFRDDRTGGGSVRFRGRDDNVLFCHPETAAFLSLSFLFFILSSRKLRQQLSGIQKPIPIFFTPGSRIPLATLAVPGRQSNESSSQHLILSPPFESLSV